jgi:hypothetical protein
MNIVYVESITNGEVTGRHQCNLSNDIRISLIQFRLAMFSTVFHGADSVYGHVENPDHEILTSMVITRNQKPLPRRCTVQL